MSEVRVAKRYAKSLLELAVEQDCLQEVIEDVRVFGKAIDENRQLFLAMKSPVIKQAHKKIILDRIFGGKLSNLTISFFDIVCRKGRASVLPAVANEFERQYNLFLGIEKASVVAASELTDDLRKEFEAMVGQITNCKQVILEEKIEPDLVGGFILKVGDKQIDDSISGRLRIMKNKLITRSYN